MYLIMQEPITAACSSKLGINIGFKGAIGDFPITKAILVMSLPTTRR